MYSIYLFFFLTLIYGADVKRIDPKTSIYRVAEGKKYIGTGAIDWKTAAIPYPFSLFYSAI